MKTNNTVSCQKSSQGSTRHRTLKPSSLVEVVGDKTHAQLEADWVSHFKQTRPTGRPEGLGWFTAQEMAIAAKVDDKVIRRYLYNNKTAYEEKKGTIQTATGEREFNFYRFLKIQGNRGNIRPQVSCKAT